ncbi:MAG: hypothetical protein DUD35_14000 [Lactobacillus sp.]|nr:hypothetical protein HMPREF0496_1062 [Lentilactobacillus hilgardii ATCC 27305]MCT3390883.1 hypothetical protein [Lentilactobacillus hilgardii]RRG07139.1 MAG: hypothetical protein DUD35_14000 [Lactobacillus sp.]
MIINPFDVAWMYVAFVQGKGGKRRSILVLEDSNNDLSFYPITHQHKRKSPHIQKQYCPIVNWNQIKGLTEPSYIDIVKIFVIS